MDSRRYDLFNISNQVDIDMLPPVDDQSNTQ